MTGVFHIAVCRKPVSENTVAQNVVKHGVGGLNIDGCRIGTSDVWSPSTRGPSDSIGTFKTKIRTTEQHQIGRWPANLIHDGSDEVVGEFPITTSGSGDKSTRKVFDNGVFGKGLGWSPNLSIGGDTGSAARFFKRITT